MPGPNTPTTATPNAPNITLMDRRISQLEAKIASKADADVFSGATNKARAGTTPPRISGLAVTNNVGTITWAWNGAAIQDLRFYRIEVADNVGMAGATTYEVSQTHFTYTDGNPATATYYARVKAVALSGAVGPNSNVVSSSMGTVGTATLDDNSVTTPKVVNLNITTGKVADEAINESDLSVDETGATIVSGDTLTIHSFTMNLTAGQLFKYQLNVNGGAGTGNMGWLWYAASPGHTAGPAGDNDLAAFNRTIIERGVFPLQSFQMWIHVAATTGTYTFLSKLTASGGNIAYQQYYSEGTIVKK